MLEIDAGHRIDGAGQAAGEHHVAHHVDPEPYHGLVDGGDLATAAKLGRVGQPQQLGEITGSLLIFLAISRISGSFSLKVCTSSRMTSGTLGRFWGLDNSESMVGILISVHAIL